MKKNIKTLKKKFRIYSPKIKEECGVFGISNSPDASTLAALGLKRMQQVVDHQDSPQIRGMINNIPYLLKVEEL